MGKIIDEVGLRIKIKFDRLNIYLSGKVGMGVIFRGKFELEIKLLGLLIYMWYLKLED